MKHVIYLTICILILKFTPETKAQSNSLFLVQTQTVDPGTADTALSQTFSRYQPLALNAKVLYSEVKRPDFDNKVEFALGDQNFRVFLYEHDIRHRDYQLQVVGDQGVTSLDPGESYTFRGYNLDNPLHQVRLTITPQEVMGYLTDVAGNQWFLQPASDFSAAASFSVFYQGKDVKADPNRTCASTLVNHQIGGIPSQAPDNSRSVACKKADVAIAADYSMYTKFGSSSAVAQHLLTVKNMMEENYSIFNVEFQVITTYVVTTSNGNPWTSSTGSGDLLNSFSCWAGSGSSGQLNCTGSNGFGVAHDVGELWSNRDFDGPSVSTVGLAWIGTICSGMYKYSVVQHYTSSLESLRVLIAHECGHNFGAGHTTSGFIMGPSVNPSATQFTTAAQTSINASLPAYTCLAACGGGGGTCASTMTITASSPTGYKSASNSISTSGSINLSGSATYDAPNVQLNPTFTVASGATLEIKSQGCN